MEKLAACETKYSEKILTKVQKKKLERRIAVFHKYWQGKGF